MLATSAQNNSTKCTANMTVLNQIRRKYMCPCCNNYLVTAKKPAKPIEKSIASPSLLTQVVTHKYCDAFPLYRQSKGIFKRLGLELDPATLANCVIKCEQLVQHLINLATDQLRAENLLFMDETVLQVLKEDGRNADQQSRMWVMSNTGERRIVLFHYSPTQKTKGRDVKKATNLVAFSSILYQLHINSIRLS